MVTIEKAHQNVDVIVVGGGHAGTEAALAAARMGVSVLLITHNIETIGQMSCNPSIGGIGKSHLVKEVDAMGGVMAQAADRAGIHFRILNSKKGAAVRATRVQADRLLYKQAIRFFVETQPGLLLFQQGVDDLIIENDAVVGVVTQTGLTFYANSIVLTTGTFLGGRIHVGEHHYSAGRAGDPAANTLSERLRHRPFRVKRLKTGTPPRIDKRSIDFNKLDLQPTEPKRPVFSFVGEASQHPPQRDCYIARTNEKTHAIIRDNLKKSAIFSGNIEGTGPRYCPSIEDKIVRFSDQLSHQVFVEPEGLEVQEIYPNGISTSLPFDVQQAFVRSMVGFEQAHITRPGYAIEYDYFDPRDLYPWLETKVIAGLFFAGQINGTTGYEEAAAQGLIAGINAARRVKKREYWYPGRDEAYMGVLIDDLVTQGAKEPYRMFTSRAEYRLLLREDNADQRLTETAYRLGLVGEERHKKWIDKKKGIEQLLAALKQTQLKPGMACVKKIETLTGNAIDKNYSAYQLLCRPECNYSLLREAGVFDETGQKNVLDYSTDVVEQVETQAKYAGYIERQAQQIKQQKIQETTRIPEAVDYDKLAGLSTEARQALKVAKPTTVGQASRLPGVTPAAVSILLVYLKRLAKKKHSSH